MPEDDVEYELDLNQGSVVSRTKRERKKRIEQTWYYFGLVGQIGFSIAMPIAGGAIIGSLLDQRLASYPRFTLGLLGAGVVISFVTFFYTIRTIVRSSNDSGSRKSN